MQKLNLVAMSYDRDKVLNALQLTGATEIKHHCEADNTAPLECGCDDLRAYLSQTESALDFICAEVENYNKENKIKSDSLKDGFTVSYSDFLSAKDLKGQIDGLVEKVSALQTERKTLIAEKAKLLRTLQTAEIYRGLKTPFAEFGDTRNVKIKLGTIPNNEKENFFATVENAELCCKEEFYENEEITALVFAYHKSFDGEGLLGGFGFVSCPFNNKSGRENYAELKSRAEETETRLSAIAEEILSFEKYIKPFKIYCDYVGFEVEKLNAAEKMRKTAKTFLLEAYVPNEAETLVKEALEGVTSAVYYEFSEPDEDEIPPTLYKNNEVVKNFETITNMYSPVNSREFDPNTVMAFFYSLFLGFIMGDIGYGLLMLLGGGFIYMKNRGSDSGLKRLSGVFAIGGIFAIVWGLLFNSLFGLPVFASSVIPDAQKDMWSFMGIQVPAVLVISLEIGVVHLMVGYICRAIQCMRRGRFWDGILDGLVWTVFSVGVGLAIAGLIDEAEMPLLAYIGGGTAGVMLVLAMLTAGRKEKLLGKFTKGFGAAYGIINYASDILSYARLYGLMLSGAVIAQIVSSYSVQFIQSGNVALIILAVILMVVGHAFNLAIGLLGAYIHDARLQYVEFYGRFYEGEGELFAPLGSQHKFIRLDKSAVAMHGLNIK